MAQPITAPSAASLKRGPAQRALVGKHIDHLLEAASKGGYGVVVCYGKAALRSEGAAVLSVRLDDGNRVVAIR